VGANFLPIAIKMVVKGTIPDCPSCGKHLPVQILEAVDTSSAQAVVPSLCLGSGTIVLISPSACSLRSSVRAFKDLRGRSFLSLL
jgi:hypothetical protein